MTGRQGFTLVETLAVLVLLSILSAAVWSTHTTGESEFRLSAAASEVAGALRFARAESLRRAAPCGVRFDAAAESLHVYRLDSSGPTPLEVFDVLHPLTRRDYALAFADEPAASGVDLSAVAFLFGTNPTPGASVAFDAQGSAISPLDRAPLSSGSLSLALDGSVRSVLVAPATGRVSVP